MASIADFFFIAGLEDDYEFEFNAESVEQSVSKETQSSRLSRLVTEQMDSAVVTSFPRQMRSNMLERQTLLDEPKSEQEEMTMLSAAFHRRADRLSRTSSLRAIGETISSSQLECIARKKDPESQTRQKIKRPTGFQSQEEPIKQVSASSRDESVDHFEETLDRRFTVTRREKGSLMRKLSSSSAMRALNAATQSRRDSKHSIGSANARTRYAPQLYDHVMPDPEPLILPPGTYPLKTKFPPRLLARYPEVSAKVFPQFLPMFAFPDDISIALSDERPNATWHGFSLTRENGDHLHGVCIILYVPIARRVAENIERRCESWRNDNMQLEQREMSNTLASKLAIEKSALSTLLLELSEATSDQHDFINERISGCEERIKIYSDLLKPVRHGTQANIEGLTAGHGMWMPRALGVLANDLAQQGSLRSWLLAVAASYCQSELLNVPSLSKEPFLPLERYVVNLCAETPRLPPGRTKVEVTVRSSRIEFLKEAQNEIPHSRTLDLYPLFRTLSLENVVLLWEAAMLECRIVLSSKHASMTCAVANALSSLLFPLKWRGIYIPNLPKRLINSLDAPTPYIMGVQKQFLDLVSLSDDDIVICDLDANTVQHNFITRLPERTRVKLLQLLSLSCPMHTEKYAIPYGPPLYCIEAYPFNSVAVMTNKIGGQPLVELLTQNSSSFVSTDNLVIEKPNLNHFRVRDIPKRGLMANFGKRDTTPQQIRRPTLGHSLSSFTAKMRGPNSGSNRISVHGTRHSSFHTSANSSTRSRSHMASPSMSSLAETSSLYSQAYAHSSAATSCLEFDEVSLRQYGSDSDVHSEGHIMNFFERTAVPGTTLFCDYSAEVINGSFFVCSACQLTVQERYVNYICLPCLPTVMDSNKIRASFIRCSASLLYNYRKYLGVTNGDERTFDKKGYEDECLATDNYFMHQVLNTQAFCCFIDDRSARDANDPEIRLFEDIILAKRNRGKAALFGKSNQTTFLSSQADSPRKTFSVVRPNSESATPQSVSAGRKDIPVPDFLDERLFCLPRVFLGALA